jgi:hypothetical protein
LEKLKEKLKDQKTAKKNLHSEQGNKKITSKEDPKISS